uniref:Fucolectin tachylectin-4 pentraxin-1 domain-containing protein n=1 Tax=Eptatretus burgeri TaxID=7764 RepID=A0A8C4N8D1_EPTBU
MKLHHNLHHPVCGLWGLPPKIGILFGKATQSSTFLVDTGAEKAVDGTLGGATCLHSCILTNIEYEPWWNVDLYVRYKINTVTIFNRSDFNGIRLRNLIVSAYNSKTDHVMSLTEIITLSQNHTTFLWHTKRGQLTLNMKSLIQVKIIIYPMRAHRPYILPYTDHMYTEHTD